MATNVETMGTSDGERPWLIWAWSFGIWIFINLASDLSVYEFQRSVGRQPMWDELALPIVHGLIYGLLTPFIFRFATRYPVQRENWMRRSCLHLASGTVFAAIHVFIRSAVLPTWDPDVQRFKWTFWNSQSHTLGFEWKLVKRLLIYDTVPDIYSVYIPVILIAFGLNYYRRYQDRELRAQELAAQLAKARLQELKSQLQPHFLFNTLHSISALMHMDVQAADKMMSCLSDLLRLSMENNGVQLTTLNRELEFLNSYLAIEKIRFGDRLKIVMDVSPSMLEAEVPHLLLQPLVENAIRHGVAHRSAEGEVGISAVQKGRHLCLEVRDNGPGLNEQPPSRGLGLETTRKRLRTLYGYDQSLEIRNADKGGVEVFIRIPFSEDARLYEPPASLANARLTHDDDGAL